MASTGEAACLGWDFGVPLITNRQLAERLAEALEQIPIADLRVRSWSRYGD
jgi:hypothetical protein